MASIDLIVGENICSQGVETIISVWLVDDKSYVEEGTIICEFMTEKVIVEFLAPESGEISIIAAVEQPLFCGDLIARIS